MNRIVLSAFFVIGVTAWFMAQTVLVDTLPDAMVVALAAMGAAAFSLLVAPPSGAVLRKLPRPIVLSSAAAGVLICLVAQLLVVGNRFTDAPPGSEVLFFTTAGWGLLTVLFAYALPSSRPSTAQLCFALIGVLGVATLVANWERPSSFSPLVRYPLQEYRFLLAGVAWAVGSVLLSRATSFGDRCSPVFIASTSGTLAAIAWAVLSPGGLSWAAFSAELTASLMAFVAFGVVFVTWTQLISSRAGLPAAASLLFLPALVVTALGIAEQSLTPRGPDPVIWTGAIGGSVLSVLAVVGIVLAADRGKVESTRQKGTLLQYAAVVLAGIAAMIGVVGLVVPAFRATVMGTLSSGQAYDVTWALLGFESAGGWAVALAGALLLISAVGPWFTSRKVSWTSLLVAVASAVSYAAVASTPLRTWNRWVPTELQSEYGTEYVSLAFLTVHHPVRLAALLVGVLAAVVIVASLVSESATSTGVRSEVTS